MVIGNDAKNNSLNISNSDILTSFYHGLCNLLCFSEKYKPMRWKLKAARLLSLYTFYFILILSSLVEKVSAHPL